LTAIADGGTIHQHSRPLAVFRLHAVARMDDLFDELRVLIERANQNDSAARAALLKCAYERLRVVVDKKLKHFARLARWQESDDVTQEAALKLWGALKDLSPRTVDEFWVIAGEQVRRVLLDLIRHDFGPQRIAAHTEVGLGAAAPEPVDATYDTANLDRWTALHEQIDQLPQDERSIVLGMWYSGLSQTAAARALGISLDTAQRRWKSARERLKRALQDERPES
jgi:RNA polymerase sigma-70 factor (ECF subfamily)